RRGVLLRVGHLLLHTQSVCFQSLFATHVFSLSSPGHHRTARLSVRRQHRPHISFLAKRNRSTTRCDGCTILGLTKGNGRRKPTARIPRLYSTAASRCRKIRS